MTAWPVWLGAGLGALVFACGVIVLASAAHARRLTPAQQSTLAARTAQIRRAHAACRFCQDLAEMGDPDDCGCPVPCGRRWCTALRLQMTAARGLARPQ